MKTTKLLIAATAMTFAMPALAKVMSPGDYVKHAGASDLYERQSSKLVLATTANPAVRTFAQMMIAQHQKSTSDVKAAAARSHVPAGPPRLMPDQAKLVAQLRAATGPARDAEYLTQQHASHDKALALQQDYATSGTAPALRATAAKIVPVVKEHIAMLSKM